MQRGVCVCVDLHMQFRYPFTRSHMYACVRIIADLYSEIQETWCSKADSMLSSCNVDNQTTWYQHVAMHRLPFALFQHHVWACSSCDVNIGIIISPDAIDLNAHLLLRQELLAALALLTLNLTQTLLYAWILYLYQRHFARNCQQLACLIGLPDWFWFLPGSEGVPLDMGGVLSPRRLDPHACDTLSMAVYPGGRRGTWPMENHGTSWYPWRIMGSWMIN